MKSRLSLEEVGNEKGDCINTCRGGVSGGDRVTVQYVMHQGKATARTVTKNKSYWGNGPFGLVIALHDAR